MLAFSIFFVVPLFFVTWGSFVPTFLSRKVTLSFVTHAFTSPGTLVILRNSLELASGSSIIAVGLGTLYASLVTRTDIPGKVFFRSAATGRLAIPILGEAFSWILLLSPSIGLVNVAIEGLFRTSQPIFNIYSMGGLILASGIGGTPFAFLVLEPAFQSMNSSFEESSRVSGASKLRTMSRITLPLITPALLSAFLISFIGALETLEYPLLIGSNARIVTLSTEVYNLANLGEYSLASAYGLFFIVIVIILLVGYLQFTRRAYRFAVIGGRNSQQTVIELGRWRWPAFFLLIVPVFLFLFLSLIVLLLVSLVKSYTVVGDSNPFTHLTLQNYVAVVHIPLFMQAFTNSILLSAGAGVLTTILGAVMSYVLVKGNQRGRNILYFISNLPLAFPGVVYSVALRLDLPAHTHRQHVHLRHDMGHAHRAHRHILAFRDTPDLSRPDTDIRRAGGGCCRSRVVLVAEVHRGHPPPPKVEPGQLLHVCDARCFQGARGGGPPLQRLVDTHHHLGAEPL